MTTHISQCMLRADGEITLSVRHTEGGGLLVLTGGSDGAWVYPGLTDLLWVSVEAHLSSVLVHLAACWYSAT